VLCQLSYVPWGGHQATATPRGFFGESLGQKVIMPLRYTRSMHSNPDEPMLGQNLRNAAQERLCDHGDASFVWRPAALQAPEPRFKRQAQRSMRGFQRSKHASGCP